MTTEHRVPATIRGRAALNLNVEPGDYYIKLRVFDPIKDFQYLVKDCLLRLSADEIADILKVSRSTVIRWSEGKNLPSYGVRKSLFRWIRNPDNYPPLRDKDIPLPGEKWRHYNGLVYTVLFLTNKDSVYEQHQPTVIYQGANGKLWSRVLSDWHRSFTRVSVLRDKGYLTKELRDERGVMDASIIRYIFKWRLKRFFRKNEFRIISIRELVRKFPYCSALKMATTLMDLTREGFLKSKYKLVLPCGTLVDEMLFRTVHDIPQTIEYNGKPLKTSSLDVTSVYYYLPNHCGR